MPTCVIRSTASSRIVIARTGVPSTMMRLVAYCAQTKSGMRSQVIPGQRIVWTVTMMLRPVRIDEKPTTKTPMAAGTTAVFENMLLKGV